MYYCRYRIGDIGARIDSFRKKLDFFFIYFATISKFIVQNASKNCKFPICHSKPSKNGKLGGFERKIEIFIINQLNVNLTCLITIYRFWNKMTSLFFYVLSFDLFHFLFIYLFL